MSPEFRKVALIAAVLGLLVSLFVALRPDGDEETGAATTAAATTAAAETTAPATTETEPPATTDAEPPTTAPADDTVSIGIAVPGDAVPEVRRFSVRRGREVEIVVRAEVSDHVHLHGYDLIADVGPGKPGRIAFTADAPGRFEIELEDRGLHIAELEVRP